MALSTLSEKANGSRLSRLLIDKGTQALRQVFNTYVQSLTSSGTLHDLLNTKKRSLQSLRYKVISAAQWSLLYPSSGSADSKDFDVTLLTCLLRNACGLTSPATGWNVMPPDTDTSIQANILRIKIYRNEVYGHVTKTDLDDKVFENLWNKIANALVDLGIPRSEIDALKEEPLSAEEEGYIHQLIAWKKDEDDLKGLVMDCRQSGDQVREIVSEIRRSVLLNASENEDISRVEKLAKSGVKQTIRKLTSTFHEGTRAWLFEKVDSWFADPESESQVMILTAGPGFGKSVFAAKVCEIYKKRGKLAACHFCKFDDSNRGNPHRLVQSLASHMCDNIDGFKAELDKELQRSHSTRTLGEAFQVLLSNPLDALEDREPMIIVVDAMDESEVDGKSELLELISEEFPHLPKWINILITSRPELHVKDKLNRLNPVEIHPASRNNESDLRHYLEARLSTKNVSEEVLSSLVWECEGSFLFAYYLQLELRDMGEELTEYNSTFFNVNVKGIAGYYERQFERLKDHFRKIAPSEVDFSRFLNVIAASKQPFPLGLLRECIGWPGNGDVEFQKLISEVSSLFPVYKDSLEYYHRSVIEWLKSECDYKKHKFTADLRKGNEYIWSACKKLFIDLTSQEDFSQLKITPVIQYALEVGTEHLLEIKDVDDCHWLVDVKLNCIKSNICASFLFYGLSNVLSEKHSWIPRDIKSKIELIFYPFREYRNIMDRFLFSKIRNTHKSFPLYLQSVANGWTLINDDLSDRECAISLLENGKHVWCEYLNVHNFQSKLAKVNSSRLEVIHIVAISLDQRLAAVTSTNRGKISLLQLPNFELVYEYDSKLHEVPVCAFAPDNSILVYGSIKSCLDVKDGKEIPFIVDHSDEFSLCSFSPSGDQLVTADSSRLVKLWDVKEKKLLRELDFLDRVGDCCFSESGVFIVASNGSGRLSMWNSLTFQRDDQCFSSLSPPPSINHVEWPINPVTPTKDSEYVVMRHGWSESLVFLLPDGLLACRTVGRSLCLTKFQGRDCFLTIVGNSVIVFDLAKKTIVAEHRINCFPIFIESTPVVFSKESFVVKEYPFISFKIPDDLKFPPAPCVVTTTCCIFSHDGLFLATCDDQCEVRIWNVKTCSTIQTYRLEQPAIAGWWSKTCLWFFLPPYLVQIPLAEQQKLEFDRIRFEKLHGSYKGFAGILAFSEGVLILKGEEADDIRVVKIVDDVLQSDQMLSTKVNPDYAAVAPDACSILLSSVTKCEVWKQNVVGGTPTWCKSSSILYPFSPSFDSGGRLTWHNSKCCITRCIMGDTLLGIIAVFGICISDSPKEYQSIYYIVVDLSSGGVIKKIEIPFSRKMCDPGDVVFVSPFLSIQHDGGGGVYIMALSDGKSLSRSSAGLSRTTLEMFMFRRHSVLGYSCAHNLLAIPQFDAYINFFKIRGAERVPSVID